VAHVHYDADAPMAGVGRIPWPCVSLLERDIPRDDREIQRRAASRFLEAADELP